MEPNFAQTIKSMEEWNKRLDYPFKFWHALIIADALETKNVKYVEFVHTLVKCNDTISSSIFGFIVQSNLLVAAPETSNESLTTAVDKMFEEATKIMKILEYSQPKRKTLVSIFSHCVEYL